MAPTLKCFESCHSQWNRYMFPNNHRSHDSLPTQAERGWGPSPLCWAGHGARGVLTDSGLRLVNVGRAGRGLFLFGCDQIIHRGLG